MARLATGIKRFALPDEFNFIRIYQRIADEPATGNGEQAINTLSQIFENRRQFDRAADFLGLETAVRDLLRRPNRRGIEYLPWWWSPLMRLVRLLPEKFYRLLIIITTLLSAFLLF